MGKAIDISKLFLYECLIRMNRIDEAYKGLLEIIESNKFN